MDAEKLRRLQAPLKEEYRQQPETARWTLKAQGRLKPDALTVKIETGKGQLEAGLHPATGGDGTAACSGDMLLESLAACAGVTLEVVATALGIDIRSGSVSVEGDLDFRGTLGISKEVPVGLSAVRLHFDLDTDASPEQLATLFKLTERYCVIFQTLRHPPEVSLTHRASALA